jgi:hypothetical protein
MRGGAVAAAPRRQSQASDLRAAYHRRLEDLTARAVDAFRDVVRGAELSEAAGNARAEFQTRVDAAGLVAAAEGLLRLVAELKVAAIVQDAATTTAEAAEVRAALEGHARQSTAELLVLRDDVATALEELETHFFASQCAVPPVAGGGGVEATGV